MKMNLIFVTLACAFVAHDRSRAVSAQDKDSRVYHNSTVQLSNGTWLRGQMREHYHQNTGVIAPIYIFLGIPYGAPPTGDKRFAAPEPAPKWNGVKDALFFGLKCPQGNSVFEDCLNLNIYSPSLSGKNPVMVWFHGGGFQHGSANYVDGSNLAAKGVVLVTVNYRLGVLGLMSSGDHIMPGNYAMLDQVLALKWIKSNIHAFGGDSDSVTIFGESSGGASVSLHVLSPLSKGLFHRAIMQSGSGLCPWAVERPATKIKVATFTKQIGRRVGCVDDTNSTSMLLCLRGVDVHTLLRAFETLSNELRTQIILTPRVETTFGFLPDYPEHLLEKGTFNKVDTLRGFNSGEYSYFVRDPENDGITRAEFKQLYSRAFSKYKFEPDGEKYLVNLTNAAYLGKNDNPMIIRSNLVNALADTFFVVPSVLEIDKTAAKSAPQNSRHFLYQFVYRREYEDQRSQPAWMGAPHASELPLVFSDLSRTSPQDNAVGEKIKTLWTNFAKSGNPVSTAVEESGVALQWSKYTDNSKRMLEIDLQSTMIPFPRTLSLTLYDHALDVFRREKNTNSSPIAQSGGAVVG